MKDKNLMSVRSSGVSADCST